MRAAEYELKLRLCDELASREIARQVRRRAQADRLADKAAKADSPQDSQALAEQALRQDALSSLAWFNLAIATRDVGAADAAVARAWLCAAVTIEWDPTVWADALLSNNDDELVLPLLLTARRMTSGRVFETLARFARERNLTKMLDGLPNLIDSLPSERNDAVTLRMIAGGEVEHLDIPSRTSGAA